MATGRGVRCRPGPAGAAFRDVVALGPARGGAGLVRARRRRRGACWPRLALLLSSLSFGEWRATWRAVRLALGLDAGGRGHLPALADRRAVRGPGGGGRLRRADPGLGGGVVGTRCCASPSVPSASRRWPGGSPWPPWCPWCWPGASGSAGPDASGRSPWSSGRGLDRRSGMDRSLAIDPLVLLGPAAAAMAAAIGLGVAAFEEDLRAADFGWRQLVTVVATGAVVPGVDPHPGLGHPRAMGPSGQRLQPVGDVDERQGGDRGLPGPVAGGPPVPQPGIVERGRRAGLRHLRGRQPRRPVAVERGRIRAGRRRWPRRSIWPDPIAPTSWAGCWPRPGSATWCCSPRWPPRSPASRARRSTRSRPTWPRPSTASSISPRCVSGTGITVYANAAWIPAAGRGGRPRPPPSTAADDARSPGVTGPASHAGSAHRPGTPAGAARPGRGHARTGARCRVGTVFAASAPAGRWDLVGPDGTDGGALALVRLGRPGTG